MRCTSRAGEVRSERIQSSAWHARRGAHQNVHHLVDGDSEVEGEVGRVDTAELHFAGDWAVSARLVYDQESSGSEETVHAARQVQVQPSHDDEEVGIKVCSTSQLPVQPLWLPLPPGCVCDTPREICESDAASTQHHRPCSKIMTTCNCTCSGAASGQHHAARSTQRVDSIMQPSAFCLDASSRGGVRGE